MDDSLDDVINNINVQKDGRNSNECITVCEFQIDGPINKLHHASVNINDNIIKEREANYSQCVQITGGDVSESSTDLTAKDVMSTNCSVILSASIFSDNQADDIELMKVCDGIEKNPEESVSSVCSITESEGSKNCYDSDKTENENLTLMPVLFTDTDSELSEICNNVEASETYNVSESRKQNEDPKIFSQFFSENNKQGVVDEISPRMLPDKTNSEVHTLSNENTSRECISLDKSSKSICADGQPYGDKCSSSSSISLSSWSRGDALKDKDGKNVQPVKLVLPSPSSVTSHKASPASKTKLKLTNRKRSAPTDKEDTSPSVKRTCNMTPKQTTLKDLIHNNRTVVDVRFSLQKLKKCSESQNSSDNSYSSTTYETVGRLDPWGVWLVHKDDQLFCLNQYSVQETLLFKKMMDSHIFYPKETLENPITLNASIVGGSEKWSILCNMKSMCNLPDPKRYLMDRRLTDNGFSIFETTDAITGEKVLQLTKISDTMPFYGVSDLREILAHILERENAVSTQSSGEQTGGLTFCRPLKVISYLKGEAVRLCRALSDKMTEAEVKEIIRKMNKQLLPETKQCFHNRDFLHKIVSL